MPMHRVKVVVASTHPIDAYGGIQLPAEAMEQLAQLIAAGQLPLHVGHDLGRPVRTRNPSAWTEPTEDGFVRVVAEYDVDAEDWASFEEELAEAGVEGPGGMSISFTAPLDETSPNDADTVLAADAHHYTDDEIAAAVVKLRALDPGAEGVRLYQLSAIPPLKVVVDLVLSGTLVIGLNLVSSTVYDALRGLLRPGVRNEINMTFRQSRRGRRVLKISIPVTSEQQLKAALDGLPDVVMEGARGTFVYREDRYDLVGIDELLDGGAPDVEAAIPTNPDSDRSDEGE